MKAERRIFSCVTCGQILPSSFEKWNAVDSRHMPEGTHSLAPRPGSLVRLTFQNKIVLVLLLLLVIESWNSPFRTPHSAFNWSAWQEWISQILQVSFPG